MYPEIAIALGQQYHEYKCARFVTKSTTITGSV